MDSAEARRQARAEKLRARLAARAAQPKGPKPAPPHPATGVAQGGWEVARAGVDPALVRAASATFEAAASALPPEQ